MIKYFKLISKSCRTLQILNQLHFKTQKNFVTETKKPIETLDVQQKKIEINNNNEIEKPKKIITMPKRGANLVVAISNFACCLASFFQFSF